MLEHIDLKKVIILDIETVPVVSNYNDLSDKMKELWDRKASRLNAEDELNSEELFFQKAGIFAEFGKIVCISVGLFAEKNTKTEFRIKSFFGDDEKVFLTKFRDMLDHYFSKQPQYICAHNGKEFDFPYMARRMLVNGIKLPVLLDIAGKKPWDADHLLDTMHLWRFGDYKNYTSLDLLAAIFDIPSPKDDIKGDQVAHVYWNEKDLDRIVNYCQKDIVTLARLLMKYKGLEYIKDEDVVMS